MWKVLQISGSSLIQSLIASKKREAGGVQWCIIYENTGADGLNPVLLPALSLSNAMELQYLWGGWQQVLRALQEMWMLHIVLPTTLSLWGAFSSSLMSLKPFRLKMCLALCVSAVQPTSMSPPSWWLGITHPCLPCLPLPPPHPATSSPCSLGQINSLSLLAASTKWHYQHLFPFLCGLDGWKAP